MEYNYIKNFELFADAWANRHDLVSLEDLDRWLNLPKYNHDDLAKRPYFSWIDLAVREGKINIYRANGLDFDTEKILLIKVFVNRVDNSVSPLIKVCFIRDEIVRYIDDIKDFLRMYAGCFVENIWEYHVEIDKLKTELDTLTQEKSELMLEERQAREAQERREAELENDLAKTEYFLSLEKDENEQLKARIVELENTPQRGAESEEITSLRWELGKLRMALEDSENARLGLSDELEVKTLELARLRQELEEVNAGRGQKPIDPREKKTLLKLIHAALSLEKKKAIGDRSLASLLAAKTQGLYPNKPVNNDTVKNKLNEIISLHDEESE